MKFEEYINNIKSSLQSLITKESSTEFIEKVSSIDKQIDDVVNAHELTTHELQDTKETLINHIKSTGFSKPAADNSNEVETPKSLDDIMKDSLEQFKEEK